MRYSILIPVYNAAAFLRQCLDSVLCQGLSDYEVILVNDGSTDASPAICSEYARLDNRFRLIHQENQGLLMARKAGIAAARGSYLLFLDADDFWQPNLLETIDPILQQEQPDILIFDIQFYFGNGRRQPFAPSFPDGTRFDHDGKRLLAAHWVEKERLNEMCRKVIRRSCIHLDDPCYARAYLNYGEDMLQTAYVLHHAATVYYCGKILYNYRINPTSITACVTLTQLKEVHSALRAKLWLLQTDYPEEAGLLSAFYFRYMRQLHRWSVSLFQTESLNTIRQWGNFLGENPLFLQLWARRRTLHLSKFDRLLLALLRANVPAVSKLAVKGCLLAAGGGRERGVS